MDARDPELEQRLKEQFRGCCFGGAIHAYAVCDSTMERAHALAREGAGEGTFVFAARQTQGRGRLGRTWDSPEGGAYFSVILKPSRPPTETPQLSLVAGLASAETIHEAISGEGSTAPRGSGVRLAAPLLSPQRGLRRSAPLLAVERPAEDPARSNRRRAAQRLLRRSEQEAPPAATSGQVAAPASVSIRWPNDILVDSKKVAGILAEGSSARDPRSTNHESQPYVVLGIGINVTTNPRDLPETATSLLEACGGVPQAEIPSEAARPSRGKAALTPFDPRSTIHDPRDPLALVSALCSNFDGWYDIWTAQGFAPIRAALRPWLNLGGLVRLTVGGSQVEGQAIDVDDQGRLLVRLESGVMRAFQVGEVTLLR